MNIQAEKDAITKIVTAFADTLNTGNKTPLPGFFAPDGLFMPDGLKAIPSNKIAGPGDFLHRVSFQIDYTPEDIVIHDDFAFARFTAVTRTQNPGSDTSIRKKSSDFFVFRRDNHHWYIYRYMFNSVKEL